MSLGGIDPLFMVYSKITDTLMYFDERYRLDFYVQLLKKGRNQSVVPFHSEYEFYNQNLDQNVVSVKRNFTYGLVMNCVDSYENSIVIRPKDISVMEYIMNNTIFPWYMGDRKVFDLDEDGRLYMPVNDQVQIPLSESSMLIFAPMIIDYSDGTSKEGCRIYINNYNNYINIDFDRLMEFKYYLCNTDFYNAALTMLNYIKMGPYGVNRSSLDVTKKEKSPSYFDKG